MDAQQKINQIIADFRSQNPRAARKQYPVGKKQTEQLQALGILDLMPKGYGFTDASMVIDAFTGLSDRERAKLAGEAEIRIERGE